VGQLIPAQEDHVRKVVLCSCAERLFLFRIYCTDGYYPIAPRQIRCPLVQRLYLLVQMSSNARENGSAGARFHLEPFMVWVSPNIFIKARQGRYRQLTILLCGDVGQYSMLKQHPHHSLRFLVCIGRCKQDVKLLGVVLPDVGFGEVLQQQRH